MLNWQSGNYSDDITEFAQWLKQKYGIDYPVQQLGQGVGFGMQGGGSLGGLLGGAGRAALPFNPLISLGLQGGGFLLDALRGDPGKSTRKAAVRSMKSAIGTDVLPVNRLMSLQRSNIMPQLGRYGEQVNQRLGLNTGRGQQALMSEYINKELEALIPIWLQNYQMKNQRDMLYNQLLSQYRG